MSLRIASSIASAALRATEVGIAVASANVANADTDGYTKKTANQTTAITGSSTASSVEISSVSSSINKYMLKTLISQQSDLGKSTVNDNLLSQLQDALGSTDSESGIAGLLSDASDALATFATTPESQSARVAAVDSLVSLTDSVRSTASTVQDLRAQADGDIAETVDDINTTLNTLDDINDQIVKAKAAGDDVGDLEDQRNTALKELANNIDINYQVDDSGAVRVSTSSGASLLDSSVHELSYTKASSVSDTTTFGAISLNGKDITSTVKSGQLAGLIELRDETLPDYQEQLDNLASSLIETLNDIHNDGTTVPAQQTLTGTQTTAASDAFSGSGTLRLAVTDEDGTAVEVQDLDLSSYSTVQDVMDAINSMGNLTASIDSDGNLVLDTGNSSYGVSLSGGSVGSSSKSFSAYFGLNDLLTGTDASDIAVSDSITADNSRLAGAALSTSSTLAVGDVAIASGDGTVASALSEAFSDSRSFTAAGGLGATTATFAGYWGNVVQSAATDASQASAALDDDEAYAESLNTSFMSQSGVNVDEETAAITNLETAYKAAAKVMETLQEMFDTAINMVN